MSIKAKGIEEEIKQVDLLPTIEPKCVEEEIKLVDSFPSLNFVNFVVDNHAED